MSDGATVDHKSLNVIYGVHRVKGRAKGDYLQVVYNQEQFTENVGIDGEGFWVSNADESARITVTLVQTSNSNDVLSALFIADKAAPGGLLLPLVIEEANGRTVYGAARARIVKLADGVWSDGGNVRTWLLSTTRLTGFVGGLGPTPLNPNPGAAEP